VIVLVGGVAGCGKTTVGAIVAKRLRWPVCDADSFHPEENIAKMRAGIPLTDADRGPWLGAILDWMDARDAAGESAVAGCSAIKQRYRDELLGGRPNARLAFLKISRELAHERLAARQGHFFTEQLMDSQFAALELPQETGQVLTFDAAEPADLIAGEIIHRFGLLADPAARPDGA
jgi:carbohydrate kinase (thermoresistant glucokinase family)